MGIDMFHQVDGTLDAAGQLQQVLASGDACLKLLLGGQDVIDLPPDVVRGEAFLVEDPGHSSVEAPHGTVELVVGDWDAQQRRAHLQRFVQAVVTAVADEDLHLRTITERPARLRTSRNAMRKKDANMASKHAVLRGALG